MKRILASLAAAAGLGIAAAAPHAVAADITGAGATFPYPVYSKWAAAYRKETGNGLNYQSIGSGGGIKQIIAKTVDFGASDMPMKPEDLQKNGLTQFPAIMGGVVPVYNLKGVDAGLKLTGEVLADIYLGKVKTWNDPAIQALNAGVKLPSAPIIVVHRSDGSGTTFLFVNYLSQVSKAWADKVGVGTSVKFPTGQGGKGNEGVANYVRQLPGAIGYVEYAYAKQNKLPVGQLKNRDGNFVAPTDATFKAAAAGAEWSKASGMALVLTNQPGAQSWPITGASFILMQKSQAKPETAREVLKFFEWAYSKGDEMAAALDYVPMPDNVVKMIQAEWKNDIRDAAGKSVY